MTTISVRMGHYAADLSNPLDIAIPVHFEAEQLCAFGGPSPSRAAYRAGPFIGDVRQGGSCNCETYHFSPHLNGTHTEGVGHITEQRIPIHRITKGQLFPALLVSVTPVIASECDDRYKPIPQPTDRLITQKLLEEMILPYPAEFRQALVIRTLPNEPDKRIRHYGAHPPPYFSNDAMALIIALGVQHLLVDLPSIDRPEDGGHLSNHRLFWGLGPDERHTNHPSPNTVTELIYVPDEIPDGPYLLNLQVAAFDGDAAPSRPVLYKVTPDDLPA